MIRARQVSIELPVLEEQTILWRPGTRQRWRQRARESLTAAGWFLLGALTGLWVAGWWL